MCSNPARYWVFLLLIHSFSYFPSAAECSLGTCSVFLDDAAVLNVKPIVNDVKTIENPSKIVTRRNWQKYSKQKLLNLVSHEPFQIETDMVQAT